MEITSEYLLRYFDILKADRSIYWENSWDSLNQFFLPQRPSVYDDHDQGKDRSVELFDGTGSQAIMKLAAGVSAITNQNTRWFGDEVSDEKLNSTRSVKEFLDGYTKRKLKAYTNSNFYTESSELYVDLSSIGTGIMYIEKSEEEGKYLHFKTYPIKEIYLAEDYYGYVDTVFRRFTMTARQCIQRWGEENCSEAIKKRMTSGYEEDKIELLHAVLPRPDRKIIEDIMPDVKNMKFGSYWLEIDENNILEEGGYPLLPYTVPRWFKCSGEIYGRSLAWAVLGDAKSLNEMMISLLKAGQFAAEPAYQMPDDGFATTNIRPNGISYFRTGSLDRIEIIESSRNMPYNFELVKMYVEKIADALMMNQIQIIDKREMTAEEFRGRMAENARLLGPTIGRLQFEYLQPLDKIITEILSRCSDENDITLPYLPIPPAEISKKNIKIKFTSPIVKNQRMGDIEALNYWLRSLTERAQAKPELMDIPNWDEIERMEHDIFGAPLSCIRSETEVEEIRISRAEQQQQQQKMQMEMIQLEAQKTGAETQKDAALAAKHKAKAESGG